MTHSMTNRRQLLKAAALGGASAAIAARSSLARATISAEQGMDGLAAFEGALVDLGPDWLSVEVGPNDLRTVQSTSASSFWKGQDTNLAAFTKGDDVLVRTLYGSIDRAWDNLTRLKGLVTRRTSRGYVMEVHDEFSPLTDVD